MNNNSFTFIPAPWIPFQDKKVLEQVRGINAGGLFAGPGFVDIHCHGGDQYWCPTHPIEMAEHHLKHGTTSLICTIYKTIGFEDTIKGIRLIKKAYKENKPGNIAGIHLEGPYLSPKYGAAASGIIKPVASEYDAYIKQAVSEKPVSLPLTNV